MHFSDFIKQMFFRVSRLLHVHGIKSLKKLSMRRKISLAIIFIFLNENATAVDLINNSEILGEWKLYAESADLHKEKTTVDKIWTFNDTGILGVYHPNNNTSESLKYSIENGSITKQINPGREKYEVCHVVTLEENSMILDCKYLHYFFTQKNSDGTITPPGSESEPETNIENDDIKTPSQIIAEGRSIKIDSTDFSFYIPELKYIDPQGFEHYYIVFFKFIPVDNRMIFDPWIIRNSDSGKSIHKNSQNDLCRTGCSISNERKINAIKLNQDFSFNIPAIEYENPLVPGDYTYYTVDFLYTPKENKMLFEAVKITEIQ
jgi:hypothetical protein